MKYTMIEKIKGKSIFFNFFQQDETRKNGLKYMSFMNDDCFVKRLEDNFVKAKILELKNIPNNEKVSLVEKVCISELLGGTNVQFAKGEVSERDALSIGKGDSISNSAIRRARATLIKGKTEKINGYYVLFVHPDIASRLKEEKFFCETSDEQLKKELKGKLVGEILDILIIEMNVLPIYKNVNGENIYCSFLFGDYAFGIKLIEEQAVCGIRRINEKHMVRIETVA